MAIHKHVNGKSTQSVSWGFVESEPTEVKKIVFQQWNGTLQAKKKLKVE